MRDHFRPNNALSALTLATVLLLASAALAAATANAHEGNKWFWTVGAAEQSIEKKFPSVVAAKCRPVPDVDKPRYNVHSSPKNPGKGDKYGTVRWDHLLCTVQPKKLLPCDSIFHAAGPYWDEFVMTGYKKLVKYRKPGERHRGCTPRTFRA